MADEELNDTQLFDEAVTEPASQERAGEGEVQVEQLKEPETEIIAEPKIEGEKPLIDDNAPLVPSWRLREINEEKRALAERVKALEAERLVPRQQEQQEQPKQAEKPARPDPLLDPDGYAAAIRTELREEALNERREESLLRARETNQQDFDEAYAAARQVVDPALKARMQTSRDPGKTLLEWHRENKTRAEIGNDLTAYKQRLREEALKDPEFRKTAMEAWRTDAQPQSNGRPKVELPPSLSNASRSNAAVKGDSEDKLDRDLWTEIAG